MVYTKTPGESDIPLEPTATTFGADQMADWNGKDVATLSIMTAARDSNKQREEIESFIENQLQGIIWSAIGNCKELEGKGIDVSIESKSDKVLRFKISFAGMVDNEEVKPLIQALAKKLPERWLMKGSLDAGAIITIHLFREEAYKLMGEWHETSTAAIIDQRDASHEMAAAWLERMGKLDVMLGEVAQGYADGVVRNILTGKQISLASFEPNGSTVRSGASIPNVEVMFEVVNKDGDEADHKQTIIDEWNKERDEAEWPPASKSGHLIKFHVPISVLRNL